MVALPGEVHEPYPERDKAPEPRSEWLPADWVDALIEGPSTQAEVIEIQPGVRWTPQDLPANTPEAASAPAAWSAPTPAVGLEPPFLEAAPGTSLLQIAAGVTAPIRRLHLPRLPRLRLRLPRASLPAWPHRRQLAVMTAAALAVATPVVIGGLSSGLPGNAPSHGAAHSPYSRGLVTPAPGLHGGGGVKPTAAPVRGSSAAAARLSRTGPAVAGVPGARPARVSSSSSPSQPQGPATSGGGSHSSSSSPSVPSASASSPSSTSGPTQSGGGGSGSVSNGTPPSQPPSSGGDGNPGPQSPLAPVQSAVSGAPSTVQGVVSQAPNLNK